MVGTNNITNLMDSLLAIMQAERPFSVEMLTQPFPAQDIKQRKGRFGKTLDYVEGHRVIQRLNEVTDNRWSNLVWWIQKNEGGAYVDSYGEARQYGSHWCALITLIIPGLGARTQVGSKAVTGDEEDDIKAAITDGIKKAATLFGIALDLYEDGADGSSSAGAQPPTDGRTLTQRLNDFMRQRTPSTPASPPMLPAPTPPAPSPPPALSPTAPTSPPAQPATTQRPPPASTDSTGRYMATQAQRDFIRRLLQERLGAQGEEAENLVYEAAHVRIDELNKQDASSLIEHLLQLPQPAA